METGHVLFPSSALLGSLGLSAPKPAQRTPVVSKKAFDGLRRARFVGGGRVRGGDGAVGGCWTWAFVGRDFEMRRMEEGESRARPRAALRMGGVAIAMGWLLMMHEVEEIETSVARGRKEEVRELDERWHQLDA